MSGFSDIFSDILSRIGNVEKKVNTLETIEYIRFYPIINRTTYLIDTTINAGATYDSGNLRGVGGISTRAKGFLGTLWIDILATNCILRISPGDETPGGFGQQYRWFGGADTNRQLMSQPVFCFLGPSGNILINCLTTNCHAYIAAFGYWE